MFSSKRSRYNMNLNSQATDIEIQVDRAGFQGPAGWLGGSNKVDYEGDIPSRKAFVLNDYIHTWFTVGALREPLVQRNITWGSARVQHLKVTSLKRSVVTWWGVTAKFGTNDETPVG